jgi:hypothetical protein
MLIGAAWDAMVATGEEGKRGGEEEKGGKNKSESRFERGLSSSSSVESRYKPDFRGCQDK